MNDFINTASGYVNTDPFLLFFGTLYIVLGLSMLLAEKQWRDFMALFIASDSLSLVLGAITLPISLFIVVFYNNWLEIASIILMVLGYMGIVKSLILLLRPVWVQKFLKIGFVQKWLWLDGLSGIVLGTAMLVL